MEKFNYKKENGITLVALVVTIIVLLILAGVGISGGYESIKTAKDNSYSTQLQMVQHELLERYTEYKVTNNSNVIVGTPIEYSEVLTIANKMGVTSLRDTGNYYKLSEDDLKKLGITETEDTYIVNYLTGEVLNATKLVKSTGEALYIYSL